MIERWWPPRGIPIGGVGNAGGVVKPSPYMLAVIADGATSYWRLGEAAGVFVDLIAANNGVVSGAPNRHVLPGGLTAGTQDDGAIQCLAAADHVDVADAPALALGDGPWSIEFLYRRDSIGIFGDIVRKGITTDVWIEIINTDKIAVRPTNVAVTESGTTVADGLYHHFCITRTGAGAGNTLIYKQGVEGHTDVAPLGAFVATAENLAIGARINSAANQWCRGRLDEVAIYKGIILTPAQIAVHVALI